MNDHIGSNILSRPPRPPAFPGLGKGSRPGDCEELHLNAERERPRDRHHVVSQCHLVVSRCLARHFLGAHVQLS